MFRFNSCLLSLDSCYVSGCQLLFVVLNSITLSTADTLTGDLNISPGFMFLRSNCLMSSIIFQFSKSSVVKFCYPRQVFHNVTQCYSMTFCAHTKLEQEMGKTRNKSKSRKSSPSPSPSTSSSGNRVLKIDKNFGLKKYREFLLKNEDKFSKDVECLTQKKSSRLSESQMDKNGIKTFRPKIVIDYRHKPSPMVDDHNNHKGGEMSSKHKVQNKDDTHHKQKSFVMKSLERRDRGGTSSSRHDEGVHPNLYTQSSCH